MSATQNPQDTFWAYDSYSRSNWLVVAHNAEMTRFLELGLRAHYYERCENAEVRLGLRELRLVP